LEELSNLKKELTLKTEDYETELSKISQALSNVEKEISTLVQALSGAQDSPAQKYITEKINSLDAEKTQLLQKKDELENLLNNQGLSQIEFDHMKNLALSFGPAFDTMDVDQKRKALRTLVNKIVWNGENVHLYLFGASDDKFPASVIDAFEPQCGDSKSTLTFRWTIWLAIQQKKASICLFKE
jgi:site-specific DNA recombinase